MAKKQPTTSVPKKLNEVLKNWPMAGGQALQVGPGTNWVNLAVRFGRSNAWDLITYNFRTTDPAEVNWYLHHHLGCDLVTKDGNNYRFGKRNGTAVDPVTIYVPQLDWSEHPGPAERPDRTPPDEGDVRLAVQVRNVLAHPRLLRIRFVLSGRLFSGAMFTNVRQLVESGAVAVYRKGKDDATPAYYDDGTNSLRIRWASANGPIDWDCSVVHEAVHAGLDYEKCRDIRVLDSEAAAYIAQAWYYLERKGFDGLEPTGKSATATAILAAAHRVAADLKMGRPIDSGKLAGLRTAITQHAEYATVWQQWCTYDGVHE